MFDIRCDQLKEATFGISETNKFTESLKGEHAVIFLTYSKYIIRFLMASTNFPIWLQFSNMVTYFKTCCGNHTFI